VNRRTFAVEPWSPPTYTEVFDIEVSIKIEAIIMHTVRKIVLVRKFVFIASW